MSVVYSWWCNVASLTLITGMIGLPNVMAWRNSLRQYLEWKAVVVAVGTIVTVMNGCELLTIGQNISPR